MPSTINSDNGVSSGTSGLKSTGGNDGILTFQSSGTETMRIDASGNVGIGTTSPSSFSGYTTVSVNNATNGGIYNILVNGTETARLQAYSGIFNVAAKGASTNLTFETNGSERMRLDSSGNVGIGTTSPGAKLQVSGGNIRLDNNQGLEWGGGNNFIYGNEVSDFVVIATNGSERARITSGGDFLVGTTSSSETANVGVKLLPGGNCYVVNSATTGASEGFSMYSTGASNWRFYCTWAGNIYATSTTITAITSDQRLKQNIVDYNRGLSEVLNLKPRFFEYKSEPSVVHAGFISQEVETVMPETIRPTLQNPEYKTYSIDWYPLLVKAIQELNAKVEAQAAEIAALKAKV